MSKHSLVAEKPKSASKKSKPVKKAKPSKAKSEEVEHDGYFGSCSWTPGNGYSARTKFGEIPMFDDGAHRAVEVMLMSAAACLNYFMVEYVRQRKLDVTDIRVVCDGEMVKRPERIKRIITRVVVDGALSHAEIKKMLHVCERACKVMNTLKSQPECDVMLMTPSGEVLA